MKQVIVLRKDLNMRAGKMCAQAAHASLKAVLGNLHCLAVKSWLNTQKKVVVRVESEDQLLQVYTKSFAAGLIAALVVDAGATEFHGVPTITCIAVGPATDSELEPITGGLKLL